MLLVVGSINRVKVQAVEETVSDYPLLVQARVIGVGVDSDVSDQPMSLEEIIAGSKNRAFKAFQLQPSAAMSFGIESGLFPAVGTQTGYLEACICSIYNGREFHLGLSCGFEVPPAILHHVLHENKDLSQSCYLAGITTDAQLGASQGLIGLLTGGRVNRKAYTKQSVSMALIQVEHSAWYTTSSSFES